MANPSKNKGTAAETAVVRWARANGFEGADRQPLRGNRDAGDVALCPGIVLEVKAHRTAATGQPGPLALSAWMGQAEAERANAGAAHCPLVVKRSGTTDVGRWFAYMPVWGLAELLGSPLPALRDREEPMCMSVDTLVGILRHAGYGSSLEAAS